MEKMKDTLSDRQVSSTLMLARLRQALPKLMPLAGFILFLSGLFGLTFTLPQELNQVQELVSSADEGSGVNWQVRDVSLTADDFYVEVNGLRLVPDPDTLQVSSVPTDGPTDDYTTLEVSWEQDDGSTMQVHMYFRREFSLYRNDLRWWLEEMRIYDNQRNPGDWIYFENGNLGIRDSDGQRIEALIGQEFSRDGDSLFTTNANGVGKVYFRNLRTQAFLPIDDLFFNLDNTEVYFFTNDGNKTAVANTNLQEGVSYLATIQYGIQNLFKAEVPVGTVSAQLWINNDADGMKFETIPYNLISAHRDGGGNSVQDIAFTAQETNTFTFQVDRGNMYPETNEDNNVLVLSYSSREPEAVQVGGSVVSCNETCTANNQCPINQRCYLISGQGRCRLADNPSSTSCAPKSNQSSTTYQPGNAISKGQDPITSGSCGASCANNSSCGTNLKCYNGECRLADNPSSPTCSLETIEDTDPTTGETELIPVATSSTSNQQQNMDTGAGTGINPTEETVLDTLRRMFTTSVNGMLPLMVLFIGLIILVISTLLFVMRTLSKNSKKIATPKSTPPPPAEPPASGSVPQPKPIVPAPTSTTTPAVPPRQVATDNSMVERMKQKGLKPPGQS